MLPDFDTTGNLPPGIHRCTWQEFIAKFAWTPRRAWLIAGLEKAARSLKSAGVTVLYIDGSFATQKDDPGDYDGCWDSLGVDPTKVDPVLLTFDPGRVAQKTKFRGEMFLAHNLAERKTGKRYMEFFQQDKDGKSKGLIGIDLRSLP